MVTSHNFAKLSIESKTELVLRYAEILQTCDRYGKVLKLYHFGEFYVEICLDAEESEIIQVEIIGENTALNYYFPDQKEIPLRHKVY